MLCLQLKMNLAPVAGSSGKWTAGVSLSLKGNAEPGDTSQFGETTNMLAAYMDNKEFSLVGRQEIDEDPANEVEKSIFVGVVFNFCWCCF